MSTYQRQIHHLGVLIDLTIIRRKRKTMAIHVFPGDRQTELRVPLKCPWTEIEAFIESRLDWMADAIERLSKVPPKAGFTEGEIHYFLGKPYGLDLRIGRRAVQLFDDKMVIKCPQPTSEPDVEATLHHFFKNACLPIFEERLAHCVSAFPVEVKPSGLRVRRMKSRWGSCSERGEICLNTLLVQRDEKQIDLVITHELCHLVHFHHNKAFYDLLTWAMPDWKVREQALMEELTGLPGGSQLSLL